MILKNSPLLKNLYLILGFSICIVACDNEEIREVTLFEKGQTEANASSTMVGFGESVDFTSTSTKVVTTDWTFEGGSPDSSINPNVTVTYTTPGIYEAKLMVKYIDNTIETKTFSINVAGIDAPFPFGGTPANIEGTIEAENYDLGGEGVGYHDTEEENLAVTNGSVNYREDDGMDIEVGTTVTNVGYTNDDEWANYTVEVGESGNYDFEFIVASGSATGGKSIQLQLMDQNTGEVSDLGQTGDFANTGGWSIYTGILIPGVSLTAGSNTLRLQYSGPDTNLDKVNVSLGVETPPIDGLKIFSERDITNSNLGQIPVNNGSFVITTVNSGAFEGTTAYLYHFDPVNSGNTGNGFALSIMAPTTSPMDATAYNYYNIALKTTSTKNLRLRMNTSAGNYWVTLSVDSPAYGLARDGAWHQLKVPYTDFKQNGNGANIIPNLDKITGCLVMRSDDADFATYSTTPGALDWYVDDIYMSVE